MFLTGFTGQNVLQLIIYLAIFVGILFLTYYVTKWIAGHQKIKTAARNFEIIETTRVTNGKYLQIVRVGTDDYFIIAIGKDEITLIGKVDKDKLQLVPTLGKGSGFSDVFASFRKRGDSTVDGGDDNDNGDE